MRQSKYVKTFMRNFHVKLFIICLTFSATSLANAKLQCISLFADSQSRGVKELKIDWNDDISLIDGNQRAEVLGQVETFFSKEKDTQVYYTQTANPKSDGTIPMIDPKAKAVFIFFHGSGTMKSGGRNFIGNMNTLAKLGYSALSFDMPFHAEGPRNAQFNNTFYLMEWVKSIVMEAKKSGKPVILAGHSFGPDVMLEFATRYPKLVDGVVALSPAGFTKELSDWYDKYTSKMKFGGDVAENVDGGTWAGEVSKKFLWSKKRLADPTQINPNLKIRILSGNREEYVPAPLSSENGIPIGNNTYDISVPLKDIFKNVEVTIEPGIGHYLFEHTDKNGHNVVLRELLAAVGEKPENIKVLIDANKYELQNVSQSTALAKKYSQDRIFKTWFDQKYKRQQMLSKVFARGLDELAKKILTDYGFELKERQNMIYQRVLNSKEQEPAFYEKFKTVIDKMNAKTLDITLFPAFAQYLKEKK